ncbi:hypothetical protein M901_2167 [Bacteriovorax sp. DB6_IX]|nr:hypothetical protein M901_2167 [Bacteriovorax sp. DB6_IX]
MISSCHRLDFDLDSGFDHCLGHCLGQDRLHPHYLFLFGAYSDCLWKYQVS